MKRRAFVSLLATTPLAACFNPQQQIVLNGNTMGTHYAVKLAALPDGISQASLQSEIDRALDSIIQSMSTYEAQSELSRFNQSSQTGWVSASADFNTVLNEALRISRITQGAFDATVGPLVNLWGFGPAQQLAAAPRRSLIEQTLAQVGYQKLQSNSPSRMLRKQQADVYVDLSSIAKGYGVDKIAALLDARGINDYLVDIGGEMRLKGRNPSSQPWRIAIEEPTPGARGVRKIIELTGQSIATSGNYRNFFEHQGQRFSHIIDPTTGWPVKHELASVTVVSDSAMYADAMATALSVLGPEKGYQLAQQLNLAALFIATDNADFVEQATPALRDYLTV